MIAPFSCLISILTNLYIFLPQTAIAVRGKATLHLKPCSLALAMHRPHARLLTGNFRVILPTA